MFTQDGQAKIVRNENTNWGGGILPGIRGNLGDFTDDQVEWSPNKNGTFTPVETDVSRVDVLGAFRLEIGPQDMVTNVPVVDFVFDIPELLQLLPGTPAVIRVQFQVTVARGKLQEQGGDENEFLYVNLEPLFSVVENIAAYAAIRSPTVYRGVAIFKGIMKKLDVRPVLRVSITQYFVDNVNPIVTFYNTVVDYLFTDVHSSLPESTHSPFDEEEEEIPFSKRARYLKFLLDQSRMKEVRQLDLPKDLEEYVLL